MILFICCVVYVIIGMAVSRGWETYYKDTWTEAACWSAGMLWPVALMGLLAWKALKDSMPAFDFIFGRPIRLMFRGVDALVVRLKKENN